ncbi:MAG: acyltransferase family protein [Clostridia bacterium]|nr:acyltransferase family protein [Clostridia bacterium]
MTNNKRNNSLDLLRLLSTIAVILLHINAPYLSVSDGCGISRYAVLFVNIITRFSVPSFVMISGAFNLHNEKNRNFKEFYCKSFYKTFLPVIVAIFLFAILSLVKGNQIISVLYSIGIGDFYNLWFMYMLFGLYLLTPFILIVKKSVSKTLYRNASFIFLCIACISQFFSTYRASYAIGVVFCYLSYYIVGNVIYEESLTTKDIRENNRRRFNPFILLLVSIGLMFITLAFRLKGFVYYSVDPYVSFFSPTIVVASVLIFIAFTKLNLKTNVNKIAGFTFYIYIFHTIWHRIIMGVLTKIFPTGELFLILIGTVLTFIVSLVSAYVYDLFWRFLEVSLDVKNKWYNLKAWK